MGTQLTGKVALITGAGRGLGRAFSERLAAMGASVAIHGRRENGPSEFGEGTTLTATAAEIGQKFGVPSLRVLADLGHPEQVDRAVAEVVSHFGKIDILVHNAGGDIGASGAKPSPNDAVGVPDLDVQAVLDNNLTSTILICQRVAREMIKHRSGRIINISSVAALAVADGGAQASYAVAKAGVNKYTKMLAAQLVEHNINVNAIAPGATKSGRFVGTVKDGTQNPAFADPKVREAFLAELASEKDAIGRPGNVEEVAKVVDFFAGPLGSFVTGEVLKVRVTVCLCACTS
jgi:3-oxoacyl-[acyl-carrier protein] reductase